MDYVIGNKHKLCKYLPDVVTTVASRGVNCLVDGMKDVKAFAIPEAISTFNC